MQVNARPHVPAVLSAVFVTWKAGGRSEEEEINLLLPLGIELLPLGHTSRGPVTIATVLPRFPDLT